MVLITGGAYAGKTAYTMAHFGNAVTDGAACTLDEAKCAKILNHYQILIRRMIQSGTDADAFTRVLCAENPECVVIIQEIGCGIIPLEKGERIWRETVGRCGCILAENADTVIRVICGIPTAVKGELL